MRISAFTPLSATSFIDLPNPIKEKHAVINIKNTDQRCFFYSIACKFLGKNVKNKARMSRYTEDLLKKVDFSGMNPNGPTSLHEISIFEKRNNASVNVYALTESKKYPKICPLRISSVYRENKHWDLLYLTSESGNSHFCHITNLSRLVSAQKGSGGSSLKICRCCLSHFYSEKKLKEHIEYCFRFKPVKVDTPLKDKTDFISWDKSRYKMKEFIPYCIYADFETCLLKINENAPINKESYTTKTHYHKPSSFCYKLVSHNPDDPTDYPPVLYRGQTRF